MREEKEKDDQPRDGEDRQSLKYGQASEQVDFAITQELMSTPTGLKMLRLWRATDWDKIREEVADVLEALSGSRDQRLRALGGLVGLAGGVSNEILAEHRYVQMMLEIDEMVEVDVGERARVMDMIEEYATKQVGVK